MQVADSKMGISVFQRPPARLAWKFHKVLGGLLTPGFSPVEKPRWTPMFVNVLFVAGFFEKVRV